MSRVVRFNTTNICKISSLQISVSTAAAHAFKCETYKNYWPTVNMSTQWFESVDLDKNGQLDSEELQTALASSNLLLSEAVVAHMIR